jgi:hypothetical protein
MLIPQKVVAKNPAEQAAGLCSQGVGKVPNLRKATLGICGDAVVGHTLALLLRDPDYYNARFLPTQSLGEAQEALKNDVWLLVLTPTPELSLERRNALVKSLKELSEAGNIPVLELAINFEARQEEEAGNESWHMVPWPCRSQELEKRIEAAWARHYGTREERIGIATKGAPRI